MHEQDVSSTGVQESIGFVTLVLNPIIWLKLKLLIEPPISRACLNPSRQVCPRSNWGLFWESPPGGEGSPRDRQETGNESEYSGWAPTGRSTGCGHRRRLEYSERAPAEMEIISSSGGSPAVTQTSTGSWIRTREDEAVVAVGHSAKRARTPPRGQDYEEIDPGQGPNYEVFDRGQCNFHTVRLNEQAVGVAVRCDQVPTEFLPTDGEVADGLRIRGVYFCTRHACQILRAKDEGRELRIRIEPWEAERMMFR